MTDTPAAPSCFEQLSNLERERVESDARETLTKMFSRVHSETGWCGDIITECATAALPVLREAMAKLVMRTR